MAALAVLGIIGGIVLWLVTATLWRAYVLVIMWGWFVIPTFALPVLTLPVAIGLMFILNMVKGVTLKHNMKNVPSKEIAERTMTEVVMSYLIPAMTLFFGWIVTFWL